MRRDLLAVARHLPLAGVWLLAAWPVLLWLLQGSDPELAVAVAHRTAAILWSTLWWTLGGGLVACLLLPPVPAWLRWQGGRIWRGLSTDQAPLRRALAELRHFATGPRHAEVGRLARLRDQHALAKEHLARAVELEPEAPSNWYQLGLVQFADGQWAAAAESFRQAEERDPGHAFGDALLRRGRALHELGDAAALPLLVHHQRQHGGGPRSHLWLAEAHQCFGDRTAAIAALRTAAAPPTTKLSAEENWCRARARVRLWGKGGSP